MVIGIISEDETDCRAIEVFVKRIVDNADLRFCHGYKKGRNGKTAIINSKKDLVSKVVNFKCELTFIVRDSDGRKVEDIVADISLAYDSTRIKDSVHICIAVNELESWIACDQDALSRFYNFESSKKLRGFSRPDEIIDVKERLKEHILRATSGEDGYLTRQACEIAQLVNLDLLARLSPSFLAFKSKVENVVSRKIS